MAKILKISLFIPFGESNSCTFHMPLFFFISGMFFHNRNDFWKRKAKSLLIPYFSFAIFMFLYWWLVEIRFRPPKENIDALVQFGNIFFPMNITSEEPYYFDVVLWFLPCLFMTEAVFKILDNIFHDKEVLIGCSILVILLLYFAVNLPWLPFWIPEVIVALPFYYAGNIIFKYKLSNHSNNNSHHALRVLAIAVIIVLSVIFVLGRNDMRSMLFYPNYIYFAFMALLLSIATLLTSLEIDKNRILEWLGKNSLTLMLIHDPIKRVLIFVYAKIFGQSTDVIRENVIHVLLLTVLLVTICVPIVILINRYGYYLLGRSK